MHTRDLVELAAIVSTHGPVLIRSPQPIPAESIEQYWTTSKVRLDRWAWRLKEFGAPSERRNPSRWNQWVAVQGVFEEILTGEILTRVWTAVLCAYDRRRGTDEAEPVARSVLIGHMEARHRVLTLLVRAADAESESAIKLNQLRRRAERWTDLMIGSLIELHDVAEFAFDPQRAKDFADDLHHRSKQHGGRHVWPLMMASMRAAFRQTAGAESPNADLNSRIGTAILSCFPPELFDATGLVRSLWLTRMAQVAEDTQGKIDELLGIESPIVPRTITGKHVRRFG